MHSEFHSSIFVLGALKSILISQTQEPLGLIDSFLVCKRLHNLKNTEGSLLLDYISSIIFLKGIFI